MTSQINHILSAFEKLTVSAEDFLGCCGDLNDDFRKLLQTIYNFTSKVHEKIDQSIPELVVDGFDAEQIWQELEIQNKENVFECLTGVFEMLVEKTKLIFPVDQTIDTSEESVEEKYESEDPCTSLQAFFNVEQTNGISKSDPESLSNNITGDIHKMSNSESSDLFFNKNAMEAFLDIEDRKALKNVSDEDDIEDYDYFADDDSEEEEEEARATYLDFFDDPLNDDMEERLLNRKNQEDMDMADRSKRRKIDNDEESMSNSDIEESPPNESQERKSNPKILQLEEEALAEKPWQLKGEVTSTSRPFNSLLEEVVEFDVSQRPAPIITTETSLRLEDIIIRRIRDAAYDDVEKKIKPIRTPQEFKNVITLDQQKSKYSLAEIYEQEYLKKRDANDPSDTKPEIEPEKHSEIKKMMKSLFSTLDSLSNFHYTPKSVEPEMRIVSNLPATMMEDVAPVTTTDVQLLAPEEIASDKKSRGLPVGKEERTATDKKRQRRKKKTFQAKIFKEKQKRDSARGSEGRQSASKNKNMSKKLFGDISLKSSKQFFEKLQDEVTGDVNKKSNKQKSMLAPRNYKL